MKNHKDNTNALPALLRTAGSVDTLETNSLCCAAAGIIAPSSATAEALIPHDKLRGAALSDATLTAPERPLAQPAEGGKVVFASSICVANKPVPLTKIVKKSVNHAQHMSHWNRTHTIGNHEYRGISAEGITCSHDSNLCGHSGKPNRGRLDGVIWISIRCVVLEGVRYFTTGTEAGAKLSQMHLKIRFGRLTSPLPLAPDFTLGLGSTVPNPLANMESRESTVDCKVARSSESIRSLGNVTALQLAYLPVQLQQHVVDTFHLKRMHRSASSYPRFKHCAPAHRRGARLNQCPPSIHSKSYDRSLWRRKI
ncbi:hypothetical protein SAMN04490193_0645 [Pseudomonas marginalis]|nr:hypothetical protein SAMN04490193_0645 [Pseudomonas marginalis]